jgi:hypothetical protein
VQGFVGPGPAGVTVRRPGVIAHVKNVTESYQHIVRFSSSTPRRQICANFRIDRCKKTVLLPCTCSELSFVNRTASTRLCHEGDVTVRHGNGRRHQGATLCGRERTCTSFMLYPELAEYDPHSPVFVCQDSHVATLAPWYLGPLRFCPTSVMRWCPCSESSPESEGKIHW